MTTASASAGDSAEREGTPLRPAITRPMQVAEAVWLAATDPGSPAHMPAGDDAVALALALAAAG